MFEEAQLYSPVSTGADGSVTVHLAHDHPGANDPSYRARRGEIAAAALAWRSGEPAPPISYTESEQDGVAHRLPRAAAQARALRGPRIPRGARARLTLPADHVPGLDEVTERLRPHGGWRYVPAAGLVPLDVFYGSLAERTFHCTQYVRHPDVPLYTPEPDIIHEVIGHGHLLATPTFGELHRLAGIAARRLRDPENLRFLSRVFWFSLEFGVVVEDGELRAYGAGILSSFGEIDEFRGMEHRPLDVVEMGTAEYDITAYQPVLYRADSTDEVMDVIGSFFTSAHRRVDRRDGRAGRRNALSKGDSDGHHQPDRPPPRKRATSCRCTASITSSCGWATPRTRPTS